VIYRLFLGYSATFHIEYPKSSLAFTLYTLHLTQEKSPQNAIFLAHPQIFHYLCTANQKFADVLKAFISACFGHQKSCKISQTQNKKAVNARWDMYILPQSVHEWTALFGGVSYSAWALIVYFCL